MSPKRGRRAAPKSSRVPLGARVPDPCRGTPSAARTAGTIGSPNSRNGLWCQGRHRGLRGARGQVRSSASRSRRVTPGPRSSPVVRAGRRSRRAGAESRRRLSTAVTPSPRRTVRPTAVPSKAMSRRWRSGFGSSSTRAAALANKAPCKVGRRTVPTTPATSTRTGSARFNAPCAPAEAIVVPPEAPRRESARSPRKRGSRTSSVGKCKQVVGVAGLTRAAAPSSRARRAASAAAPRARPARRPRAS
jgi:hypothetical protein